MENVAAFNSELSGLYESKPPISKAKMASITKAAMRAIKFYKHVVQSVEKFILKCKPEYKVPGLYVIDSIVRQSRHQFGSEKDVFAPRFARNIKETFANLFRCAPEDKCRIIRVLNLWQKNNVFAPEVIQPIFDLADPNHPIYQMQPPGMTTGPGGIVGLGDISANSSNGLNSTNVSMDMNMSGSLGTSGLGGAGDEKIAGLPDLSNNNLKQLLNDPNVLRQLQTLQNFQKMKQQQEDKQHKLNEMRLQEEAFEKHLQNVLKGPPGGPDIPDFKEVEFVSEEQKIEVINLDGNDSRSPSPDRDRYKRRRSRSRSRSRERRRRRSRSRSRSRSPRMNRRRLSRDRERSARDKEREREHERERRRKGLPEIRKEHLSVCSTTLWVGHLSKLVYQEELSDTFGEYGDIVSIDQIVPRGCAFIVMHRRQDAHKAMQGLKNHKLQGRAITISWAAGKGVKSKEWKDFWDLELGVTYIPWNKLDKETDFDSLEEGGMFDEDSMPGWLKDKIHLLKSLKEKAANEEASTPNTNANNNVLFNIDTTQPPPGPPPVSGPPPMLPMVPGQFTMAPPMAPPPRMMGPMSMPLQGIPMPPTMVPGMPPPHLMMPTNMLPPGFPPMPQIGSGPPPLGPPMGMPPGMTQFPPPPLNIATGVPPPTNNNLVNLSNDDQMMDIEMDDEENQSNSVTGPVPAPVPPATTQIPFSHPPPIFTSNINQMSNSASDSPVEIFSRDRNRNASGGPSRWGDNRHNNDDADGNENRWRENNGQAQNFNENHGGGGFGGGGRNNGQMNVPPMDMNNMQQRPDFMGDFDHRGGPNLRGAGGHGGGGNMNGDFFNNMQNRFNQPTSLMQMRIQPPNNFNQRMGGPPMFIRGGQGQGGPGGNRQQGPGFFNNPRNPFERDNNMRGRSGRGGGRGGRNSGPGNMGMGGNWSDDEGDDGNNNFKRRGPPNVSGNRFRDRDGGSDDRHNRDRGGRRGMGERGGAQRDRRDDREWSSGRSVGNRRSTSIGDERNSLSPIVNHVPAKVESRQSNAISDTEDDWDRELQDYDARKTTSATTENKDKTDLDKDKKPIMSKTANSFHDENQIFHEKNDQVQQQEKTNFRRPSNTETKNPNNPFADKPKYNPPPVVAANSTPLYDELPPPGISSAAASPPILETPPAALPAPLPAQLPPTKSISIPHEREIPQKNYIKDDDAVVAPPPKTVAVSPPPTVVAPPPTTVDDPPPPTADAGTTEPETANE